MLSRSFEDRFTGKLAKIDPAEVEAFLKRLIQDKGFLEVVFNALEEGIIVAAPDMKVLACNTGARHILGLPDERRMIGSLLTDVVPVPELRKLLLAIDAKQIKPTRQEVEVIKLEGGREISIPLLLRTQPLFSETDELLGMLVLLIDLTEERRIDEQRRHIERLASLATLTAGIAHEVKNPLNSLSIHAQLLKKKAENEAEQGDGTIATEDIFKSLRVIMEEAERLGAVVDEFLQAVRPTKPSLEAQDPNEICRHVADLVRPECEKKGIALKLKLDAGLGLAQYDERQLKQAILNLVKNSMEAFDTDSSDSQEQPILTLEGDSGVVVDEPASCDKRITLTTRGRPESVSISVSDNGPGIPDDMLKKIFEPYYTTKFYGTGLGLVNVYRIVEEHEGTIDLLSEPHSETAFTITLPRKVAAPIRELPDLRSEPSEEMPISEKVLRAQPGQMPPADETGDA
jgi:signal transduction histidine kinase